MTEDTAVLIALLFLAAVRTLDPVSAGHALCDRFKNDKGLTAMRAYRCLLRRIHTDRLGAFRAFNAYKLRVLSLYSSQVVSDIFRNVY